MQLQAAPRSSGARGVEARSVRSFEDWRALMGGRFVPLRLSHDGGAFRGALRSTEIAGGCVSDVVAGAHSVVRTADDIRAGQTAHLKLTMQLDGACVVRQDGREALVEPGDFAIYDTGRPYELVFAEPTHSLVMMLPHRTVGLPPRVLEGLTAVAFHSESGVGVLVRSVLEHLAGNLDDLVGPAGDRVLRSAMELVAAALSAEVHRDGGRSGHVVDLGTVMRYVDAHLADPDLGVGTIAAAHHISVRSVQQLFHEAQTTVTAHVRARRIERCCADLADPLHAGRSILDVASAWGFTHAAHFSRVFRAHVGTSPSAYRSAAARAA